MIMQVIRSAASKPKHKLASHQTRSMGRELHTRGDLKDVDSKNGFIYIERSGRPRLHRSACKSLHRYSKQPFDVKLGGEKASVKYTYFDTFDEARRYVTEEDHRQIEKVTCVQCRPATLCADGMTEWKGDTIRYKINFKAIKDIDKLIASVISDKIRDAVKQSDKIDSRLIHEIECDFKTDKLTIRTDLPEEEQKELVRIVKKALESD